jgi:pilus assembly protein CpaB
MPPGIGRHRAAVRPAVIREWAGALGRAGARGAAETRAPSRSALRRLMRLRRVAAASLVGLATWLILGAALPAPPAGVAVLEVTRDLPAGAVLRAEDVRRAMRTPPRATGALSEPALAVGQRLAAPIGAGETLTATRLLATGPLTRLASTERAVHVPLSDPGIARVLQSGDRVDLFRVADGARVADDLVVLAVDAPADPDRWGPGTAGQEAGGVLVAVPARLTGPVVQAAQGIGRTGGVQVVLRVRR